MTESALRIHPYTKKKTPTDHGETARFKSQRQGVRGVGDSVLRHKNKTTTYRRRTLVLRRSSAFLTNLTMRTWWSSRCIRSSTLAWRLCFFIPQLWLHSPKANHASYMGAASFPKTNVDNDHGLLSRERLRLNECGRPVIPTQCLPLVSLLHSPRSYVWIPIRSSGFSKAFVRKYMERELCSFWKE